MEIKSAQSALGLPKAALNQPADKPQKREEPPKEEKRAEENEGSQRIKVVA